VSSKLGGDYGEDFFYPSEDEIIQGAYGLAASGSNVYGKTPANKLNYLQDVASSLGVPLMELFGAPPDYGPAPTMADNPAFKVYGSNPVFAKAFELMDTQGMDPRRAYEAAVQGTPGYRTSPDDRAADLDIVNQYAYTRLRNEDEFRRAEEEYKRKSAGGGVSGWRTEKDLWADAGVPVDDIGSLTNQLASQVTDKRIANPKVLNTGSMPKNNVSRIVRTSTGIEPAAQNGMIGPAATGVAKRYVGDRVAQAGQNKVRSRDNARAMQMMTMLLPLLRED
jgi:hypothetical protein